MDWAAVGLSASAGSEELATLVTQGMIVTSRVSDSSRIELVCVELSVLTAW